VIRVVDHGGQDTPVFGTNFDNGLPPHVSGGGELAAVSGFGATLSRLDTALSNSGMWLTADAGFTSGDPATALLDFQQNFAVRWNGQLAFDPPGDAESGEVSFVIISIDGHRLFLDGQAVLDADLTAVDSNADGIPESIVSEGVVTLRKGLHNLQLEYFQNADPYGYILFGWDPLGGTSYDYIPLSNVVQVDDVPGMGRDDLVVSAAGQTLVFSGRTREHWLLQTDPSTQEFTGDAAFTFSGAGAVRGVGDFDRDGRADFAVVDSGQIRIFSGRSGLSGPVLRATITGSFGSDVQVYEAGDVDADGTTDLLISGSGGSWLVFGDSELSGTVALGDLLGSGAIALPEGRFRPIGDFDGDGAADLGAAVMVQSNRLRDRGVLERQVLAMHLGARVVNADLDLRESRAALETRLNTAADLMIEPGRATYSQPGLVQPRVLLFGPLDTFEQDGAVYTRLAAAGPAGDALRLYEGDRLGPMQVGAVAAAANMLPPDYYRFELATPIPPGFGPRDIRGINVAEDANPAARDAFGLRGTNEDEGLSGAVQLVDFNGDRETDLLVYGSDASYVLLGPVELDDVTNARDEADFVIAADVGRPAMRMGDVSGDGKTDLVFIRKDGAGGADAVITVIMGGGAGGLELPGYVDRAWVQLVAAAQGQNRVRELVINGAGWLVTDQLDMAVLNWDDDGLADLLITYPDGLFNGFIFSGQALWRGADASGTQTFLIATDLAAAIWADTSDRQAVAQEFLNATIAVSVQLGQQLRATVVGDVNGDGLDDVLFADPGYASFPAEDGLPSIGRAYLITGRTGGGHNITLGETPFTFFGTEIDQTSSLIVQDISLGGGVWALGDLNQDGYDDFAISTTQEGRHGDLTREGGLLIFYGSADWGAAVAGGRSGGFWCHQPSGRRPRRHHHLARGGCPDRRPSRRRFPAGKPGLQRYLAGHGRRLQRGRGARLAGRRAAADDDPRRIGHAAGHRRTGHGLRAVLDHRTRLEGLLVGRQFGDSRRVRVQRLRYASGRAGDRPERRPPGRHPDRGRRRRFGDDDPDTGRRQDLRRLRRLDAAQFASWRSDRGLDKPDRHRQRRLPGRPRHRPC
jgi:hypothetical protein